MQDKNKNCTLHLLQFCFMYDRSLMTIAVARERRSGAVSKRVVQSLFVEPAHATGANCPTSRDYPSPPDKGKYVARWAAQ